MIQENMKSSHTRMKRCHDKQKKALEFQEGDHVILRATHMTSVGRALKSKKPHFIGLYQISQRIGFFTYRVAFPPSLSNLYDIFHVSQLQKYIPDPPHISDGRCTGEREPNSRSVAHLD